MDAFFASVELLRYPQLKGLPVVIGGARRKEDDLLRQLQTAFPDDAWHADTFHDRLGEIPISFFPRIAGYVGRGVITTATYAARQFGVGSAMGLMKAAKLCPQAILLPVDFDRYRHYSQRFKSTIAEIAPVIENRGIDEVFIDFTNVPGGQREGGRVLARLIQKAIFEDTGLTCSIGVAPNKLLAKMASELKKPNGISVVYEEDLETLIWPLACRKVNGIGATHGIHTIGELAKKDNYWLIENFGKAYGSWLHDAAHGRDDRPVVTYSEPVSISRETTFSRDLHAKHDRTELSGVFTRLCEQVAADLQRKGYVGKTIGVKLRYENFQSVTRDHTLEIATDQAQTIRHTAGLCLKRVDLNRRFRLLGVRVGSLIKAGEQTAESTQLANDIAQDQADLFF
ncbi:MAG: DNA polymerase IV [Betaproteobacteria bacterium]|nr:DNA polymerase IV [Betaproteobacteria bacterium]